MGYTISIKPIHDRREKLIAFAVKQFKRWSELANQNADYVSPLLTDPKDLDYCHRRGHIGFNYNAGGLEREYAHCLIRWMALKAGERREYFYDGDEQVQVDPAKYRNGMLILEQLDGPERKLFELWDQECGGGISIIQNEMDRLEKEWARS